MKIPYNDSVDKHCNLFKLKDFYLRQQNIILISFTNLSLEIIEKQREK